MHLEKIKEIELDILKTTSNILEKHGIKYYISYGTCIGAVRHHGFIPWDDDIDISIFRNEYEKARTILLAELPSKYIYCDHTTESEYPYNFAKIRLRDSSFVQASLAHLNINHGIYIDIFPIDNCKASFKETKKLITKIKYLRALSDISMAAYKKYGKLRPLWQLPIILFSKLLFNPHKLRISIEKLCQSGKEDSKFVGSFLTPYGTKDIYKREWFGDGKMVSFENEMFRAPQNTDAYLKHIYGDYMKLPPEEKRESNHDVIFTSIDKPYKPR